MLNAAKLGEVTLSDGLFKGRRELDYKYLMELDSTCLLQNFYWEAGIIIPGLQIVEDPTKAKMHWGWESPTCQLRGHFLGHWMSSSAMLYATTGDREIFIKLDKIVDELSRCQQKNGGKWVGSIPEKYMDLLKTDDYIWSPQYTMHKTVLGLMHAYQYAGIQKALTIVSNLADWYVDWVKRMEVECPNAIYRGESGGMLEVWATLYELTGEDKFLFLARSYASSKTFERLLAGEDALTNNHTNASIPLAHGACKMYEVTGEEKYLEIAKRFFDCAYTERGAYCTGSQNAGEFWIPMQKMGQFISERSQEFCTVYNMVRLADYLYRFTGDARYGDFIELSIYNGFLTQQNKFTGMPTYFLPMEAGSHKTWGSKRNDFWCCHGSMIQSQTIYQNLVYYEDPSKPHLYVSQFIPTEYKGGSKCSISVKQTLGMQFYNDVALFDEHGANATSRWVLNFEISSDDEYSVSFRVPKWAGKDSFISIDGGEAVPFVSNATGANAGNATGGADDGYYTITRKWDQTNIVIYLDAQLTLSYLPDIPSMAAVMHGPLALVGITDADEGLDLNGKSLDDVLVPHLEHTYAEFPWMQSNFRTIGQKKNFAFRPFYDVVDEEYTVYFTIR